MTEYPIQKYLVSVRSLLNDTHRIGKEDRLLDDHRKFAQVRRGPTESDRSDFSVFRLEYD